MLGSIKFLSNKTDAEEISSVILLLNPPPPAGPEQYNICNSSANVCANFFEFEISDSLSRKSPFFC